MKKYTLYILLIIGGIGLGYLFFGKNSAEGEKTTKKEEAVKTWTCSMHPKIRKHEPGKCPICGMELIPVNKAEQSGVLSNAIKMSPQAMALANIQTTTVGKSSGQKRKLSLSGTIKLNKNNVSSQPAYFSGRIEELYVEFEGEKVQKGELLAKIYAPELIAAQQELLSAAENKKTNPKLYRAVRQKLRNWNLSPQQIDAIESSGEIRRSFPVYAQTSGIVIEKNVAEGDYVKKGQPLYKIASLNSVWAVFDAYENQLNALKAGQEIRITAQAYPGKVWNAKINFIQPTLNKNQRTVQVRAVLENPKGILKPGMFAEGKVTLTPTKNSSHLTVPRSAVLWTGERSIVYIQPDEDKPIFKLQEVLLGDLYQDSYEILSGLNTGDQVVTHGTFTVDAAAQLQGKKSMMTRNNLVQNYPEKFSRGIEKILGHYFNLKNALVNGNPEKAAKFAEKAEKIVQGMPKIPAEFRRAFAQMKEDFTQIAKTPNLKKQRKIFIGLSALLIEISGELEFPKSIYIQKCPMANHRHGARWLSRKKVIKNPYFGHQMLKCGSVIDSI